MKNWEEDRPVNEEELTPQQREVAVAAAKERLRKQYERGRKTIKGMMGFYIGIEVIAVFLSMFVNMGGLAGNLLIRLMDIGLAIVIAYNLYNGKVWARTVFGILLVMSVMNLCGSMMTLDIGRTDYSRAPGNTTLVSTYGKIVEVRELPKAEILEMQKQEDARAAVDRTVMVVNLIFLAVYGGSLYLLFAYHPVKEFLYGQETSF